MAYSETSERKSHLYYAKRREFCLEAALDPDELLRKLTAIDVKAWFNWIKDNFQNMDPDMRWDYLNICGSTLLIFNQVSKEMGLWKLLLPKPTANSIDLLEFQVTHLVYCDLVFADEKQCLYPLVGLNLLSISACRAVLLFNTRHVHGMNLANSLSNGFLSDLGYNTGVSGGLGEMEELTSKMDNSKLGLDYKDNNGYTLDGSTRHIKFYIIRNPPRIKRFAIKHEDNLLFNLLLQLLALGINDDIFVATIWDVVDIYIVPLPHYQRGIRLKIKQDKLDLPIFREPKRTKEGYHTSILLALRARTWARYIKKIRRKTDHESNVVKYYLNKKVNFDTAAAFHRRASNEVVQREMWIATLEAQHDELGLSLVKEEDPKAKKLLEEALEIALEKNQKRHF
ncbi:hypothetical protein BJY00DRAFT_305297 [Aspergillus carlsbadensis]|nr:hypothetical protein BJY00DRAFT_305297 [Aspergillus carlsbadensis]